jgi:hypothetical protein
MPVAVYTNELCRTTVAPAREMGATQSLHARRIAACRSVRVYSPLSPNAPAILENTSGEACEGRQRLSAINVRVLSTPGREQRADPTHRDTGRDTEPKPHHAAKRSGEHGCDDVSEYQDDQRKLSGPSAHAATAADAGSAETSCL